MGRLIKLLLKGLGILLLVVLVGGLIGWWYVNRTLLNFEKEFVEQTTFVERTTDGYTYLDRNGNGTLDRYEDDRRPMAERIDELLSLMTREEKIHLLKGSGLASAIGIGNSAVPGAVGTIVPTPRLGLPTLYLSDGPAGLRIEPRRKGESRTYYCTAFPIASTLASTWNTDLVREVGNAMGTEAREYGIDVILGPGANIHRHPFCGRNFEYYSEDPVVTGLIGAAMVNGIETQGVGTSVKHYVANNQETTRNINDALVSERALREIYLKGFELIVDKAQPATIMSSYNKVNGTYVAESKKLLTDILREEWDFEGVVMSDWFGGSDAAAMVSAGNDLLEPGTNRQWQRLKEAAAEGTLSEAAIDRSVRRILALILNSKKMQGYAYSNNPDLEAHAGVARQAAAEGIVLLKNEQTLPLAAATNVALLGTYSYDFIAGGTGSGDVHEAYTVSLEEGLAAAGFKVNAFAKQLFVEHRQRNEEAFVKPQGLDAMLTPYEPPAIAYTADQLQTIVEQADIGIITIGRNSGEGGDRVEVDDFLLTSGEQALIADACAAFHAAGKRVVVVLNIGGVIETASWKASPDAIVLAWQGGQEGGHAVADILRGSLSPSGKLPMTFPMQVSDHLSHNNFPLDGDPVDIIAFIRGETDKPEAQLIPNKDYTRYEEGIYVGYRHFDKAELSVSYPFGYGLSYTSFVVTDATVEVQADTLRLEVALQNTGPTSGKEVIQVYSSLPSSSIDRPVQELRAFAKTAPIPPGDSTTVSMAVPVSDFRYWSETANRWVLEPGTYNLRIGTSSRDIQLVESVELR